MGAEMVRMLCPWGLGLALSVVMERLLTPRPALRRPFAAWGTHAVLWSLAYATLLLLLARPWCAMLAVSVGMAVLVLVSNAKFRSMREPFLAQDYDYFLDAFRYPRLFLPFLGVRSFLLAAFCVLLAAGVVYLERPLPARFSLHGPLGCVSAVSVFAVLWLRFPGDSALPLSLDPAADLHALGFLPYLHAYAAGQWTRPAPVSPLERAAVCPRFPLPHMVAVQSESFFDPRSLHAGIRRDVLRNFDRLCAEARQYGPLTVPAWGANTERTEFGFLTGISPEQMGMHRFNPYRLVTRGWPAATLPRLLKSLGYRTIAVHPHYGAFYGRDRIFRQLGFDEFLDIRAFAGARHVGAYVADAEVGDRIAEILREAAEPTFVFAVTMENHGPLHLEHVEQGDAERLYAAAPPPGCDDLTVYLRHLRNADGMFGTLREVCLACGRPASLCIYGDHVPIMPQAYAALGLPGGDVPYVLWDSRSAQQEAGEGSRRELLAHDLAAAWLQASVSGCAVAEGAHGGCALSAGRQS